MFGQGFDRVFEDTCLSCVGTQRKLVGDRLLAIFALPFTPTTETIHPVLIPQALSLKPLTLNPKP